VAKQRVYELARELGLESKEVLERAQELGIEVKTASSGLDEEGVALVRMSYEDATDEPVAEEEAAATEAGPDVESGPAAAAVEPTEPAEVAPAEAEVVPPSEPEAEEAPSGPAGPAGDEDRILTVDEGITVGDFARLVGERTGEVVRTLMGMGELIPGGGAIPVGALEPLGRHFGYDVLVEEAEEEPEEDARKPFTVEYEDAEASLQPRPPVVTVMGHVDHGKTQLLDTIRRANVVEGEAGGITQHIGAYQVEAGGQKITFIDTPGHEAFTALRARGANITDIVVLVVAADDGVMPQTQEAIDHAGAAGVPIIVAINKMDLEAADPYGVRAALTQHNIVVTELGGDVEAVEVSALKGDGIEDLLETIALTAELEELKANPGAPAVGTVIEAELEVGRGPVATVIVQRGTLKRGDAIVAGAVSGRVRAMFDENGNQVKSAVPSTPVLVMGWGDVPVAGDMFKVAKNEREARKIAQQQLDEQRAAELTVPTATERLSNLLEQLRTQDHAELRIIVKADAHGSLEALRDAIAKITREDGSIHLIRGDVGGITANDVTLAETADAVIYGFNVRPDANARKAAKEWGIDIRTFRIIYELLDDVEGLLVGELEPEEIESFLGVAEVRATFRAPRYGLVAGCYVTEGQINRNARARLVRDGVVVYDGRITSLRRFKDDVQSVNTGFECGIGLENFRDIKEGDTIESYEVREVARS
jgi:translation initiation factor IF-2